MHVFPASHVSNYCNQFSPLQLSCVRRVSRISATPSTFCICTRSANMANALAKAPILAKNFLEAAKPRLATFIKYAKVELAPPTPADIPRIKQGLQDLVIASRTGRWKQLPVKQVWLNTLVTTEIILWFFIGECIGKRNVVGYKV